MWLFIGKILVAAILISTVSWLSGKKTALAGFLAALPLTTLIALAFSHIEWGNQRQSVEFAKNIFLAVPLSLLFFLPFLLAQRWNLSFWTCYGSGVFLLGIGYCVHSHLARSL